MIEELTYLFSLELRLQKLLSLMKCAETIDLVLVFPADLGLFALLVFRQLFDHKYHIPRSMRALLFTIRLDIMAAIFAITTLNWFVWLDESPERTLVDANTIKLLGERLEVPTFVSFGT